MRLVTSGPWLVRIAIVLTSIAFCVGVVGCGSQSDPNASAGSEAPIYSDDVRSAAEEEVAQEQWEDQEGADWDEFNDGYLSGWEEGCDVAFERSPDGSLYDQGNEYTADDCYDLAPYNASASDVPVEIPLSPYDEGGSLGETDGCVAAFDELPSYGVLNWGEDSFDESVCP